MLLSDASESLSSIKSLITPDCIKSSSVTTALFQESIQLKLKLFDTGDRLPDFANVAPYALIKSLSDSSALSIKPLALHKVVFYSCRVEEVSLKCCFPVILHRLHMVQGPWGYFRYHISCQYICTYVLSTTMLSLISPREHGENRKTFSKLESSK